MPLTAEFEYFLECMDNNKPMISNGEHGLEVVKILVETTKQFQK